MDQISFPLISSQCILLFTKCRSRSPALFPGLLLNHCESNQGNKCLQVPPESDFCCHQSIEVLTLQRSGSCWSLTAECCCCCLLWLHWGSPGISAGAGFCSSPGECQQNPGIYFCSAAPWKVLLLDLGHFSSIFSSVTSSESLTFCLLIFLSLLTAHVTCHFFLPLDNCCHMSVGSKARRMKELSGK